MFLIWERSATGYLSAYKCTEIPTNGNHKPRPYIASVKLTAEDFALPVSALERLYPAPKEST